MVILINNKLNNKTLFLSVLLFFLSKNAFVQLDLRFNFDTVYNSSVLKENNEIDFISIDNEIYFFELTKRNRIIFQNVKLTDSFCVQLPDSIITNTFEFDYFDDVLILTSHKSHYIFNRVNNNFKFFKKKHNNFRNSKVLKNKRILFFNNYNFHPQDCPVKDRSKLIVFDIINDTIINQVSFDFNYIFYTHLVSNFIDVNMSRSLISVAQTFPYEISIYNIDLQLTNVINKKLINNTESIIKLDSLSLLSNKYLNTKLLIREVSLNDKNINRIQKVYFSNDSILLVIKKMSNFDKNKKNRYLDVIKLNDKKPVFLVNDKKYSSSIFQVKEEKILPTVPFTNSGRFIFNKNHVFFIKEYVPLNNISTLEDLMLLRKTSNFTKSTFGLYRFNYEIN